jgi:hypothetical protein
MERSNTTSTEGDGPVHEQDELNGAQLTTEFEEFVLRSSWVFMFAVRGIRDLTVPWEHEGASWPTTAVRVTWAGKEHTPETREQWVQAMRGTYSLIPLEQLEGVHNAVMGTTHDDLRQHYETQAAWNAVGCPHGRRSDVQRRQQPKTPVPLTPISAPARSRQRP